LREGVDKMNAVKKGDVVKVHYTGTLDSGETFDSSEGKDPITFTVGAGQVIKGFDEAVVGMKTGEEKSIKIKPEEAYGLRNEQYVKEVPKKAFPPNMELRSGMMVVLGTPDGQKIAALVKEVKQESAVIDFNHPLAGKNLNFKITVVEITSS
jgi:peptidylprolyl isomerase